VVDLTFTGNDDAAGKAVLESAGQPLVEDQEAKAAAGVTEDAAFPADEGTGKAASHPAADLSGNKVPGLAEE
jgi:hypothetical protein